MGLFDRFKKKEEPKVERDIAYYSKKLPDGISEIEVDGLSRIQKFRHRDNSETSLILGRIETVEGNNAFMIDSADYIAFDANAQSASSIPANFKFVNAVRRYCYEEEVFHCAAPG